MLDQVISIAQEASALVMSVYGRADFSVKQKDDLSPVTAADLASHELICRRLSEISELPVLSEESPIEYNARKNWSSFWLVDPLDGTKDFIARNDEFTVNIALIRGTRPVLGVVAAPALGCVYYASAGGGAYKLHADGIHEPIRNSRSGRTDLICATSRFHDCPEVDEFCHANGITSVIKQGSALKLCKLAEGAADIYARFVPTKEWDTAAGHCIVAEAGCALIDLKTMTSLSYNKREILNSSFIALRLNIDLSALWLPDRQRL